MIRQPPPPPPPSRLMQALRHVSGLFLGAIGAQLLIACLYAALGEEEVDSKAIVVCLVLGLGATNGAIMLLWRRTIVAGAKACPECGHAKHAPAGLLRPTGGKWAMMLGGSLLAALWGESRRKQVRCTACDHLFLIETRGSRIAGILLWILVLMIAISAIVEALLGGSED